MNCTVRSTWLQHNELSWLFIFKAKKKVKHFFQALFTFARASREKEINFLKKKFSTITRFVQFFFGSFREKIHQSHWSWWKITEQSEKCRVERKKTRRDCFKDEKIQEAFKIIAINGKGTKTECSFSWSWLTYCKTLIQRTKLPHDLSIFNQKRKKEWKPNRFSY